MKIPDRVVAVADEAYLESAYGLNSTSALADPDKWHKALRAAITAALEEWVKSGMARKANAYNIGADSQNPDMCGCWVADERIPDSDDDAFPVLIIRLEAAEARAMIKTALEVK